MALDIEKMKLIVEQVYALVVVQKYGDDGAKALHKLLEGIHFLYGYINPELITGSFTVFLDINQEDRSGILGEPVSFENGAHLAAHCDLQRQKNLTIIQIMDNNQFNVWKNVDAASIPMLKKSIIYTFSNNEEHIVIEDKDFTLTNPGGRQHASIFSTPNFRTLADALENYKWGSIKTSRCQIFSQVWDGGPTSNRLFFIKKPEELMRKSLTAFLQAVLRDDAYVHPEVNVDESHPVDIQVYWQLNNRIAIIEIKWVGNSLSDSGVFLEYRDARANHGAKQLAEYLVAKDTWAPLHEVMGYLVIFDARRSKLQITSTTIDEANGFHYRDIEIGWNPEFHKIRHDFVEPIRMFAEPICSQS